MQKYADFTLEVGLALGQGDRLIVEAPIDAADFTRVLVDRAYQKGAVTVDVIWDDDAVYRSRFVSGTAEAMGAVTEYSRMLAAATETADCWLRLVATDPARTEGAAAEDVARFEAANRKAVRPFRDAALEGRIRWSVIGVPTPAWASAVYEGVETPEAVNRLWEAIFRVCGVDGDDPAASWWEHNRQLVGRAATLNEWHFASLRYRGPGTDLSVRLPDRHVWEGGATTSADERVFEPNLPTEEVFTAPHRTGVDGRVSATKPLFLHGKLVEDLVLEVSEGAIVSFDASSGRDIIERTLATDEGAVRFGEVALVPQSSRVARERLIWKHMLFDENDACHIAFGLGYPTTIEGGLEMTADERQAAGLNTSSVHVDFVVGSERLDVFGVHADGSERPLLIGGEWAFEI